MFCRRESRCVPVVEALEKRELMSGTPLPPGDPLHGLWGKFQIVMKSGDADPNPFTWTDNVKINHRNGHSFDGWIYFPGGRKRVRGAETPDGYFHFSVEYKQYNAKMLALYNPAKNEFDGVFAYAHDHKDHPGHRGDMVGTFTLSKPA